MKAMILDDNRNFSWQELPDPVPGPGEVLIRVAAASVNRADLLQRDGCYASPEGWPAWCGLEVAGIVVSAPKDANVHSGDKVCALLGGGGYSELVTAPAEMVLPIPENLSLEEAASIPEVWATAYFNLFLETDCLTPADTLYLTAGASGIGIAAIQLAQKVGAKVVATVGSPEKAEFVKGLGVDRVLDYRNDDIFSVLKETAPTITLDCVGGKWMGLLLPTMAFQGRWIMLATLGGAETRIDLEQIWRKNLRLVGSTLRNRSIEEKGKILRQLQAKCWPLFTTGDFVTHIHAVLPIQEAEKAQGILRRNENIGKILLSFDR